jgi:hypothetical protein
LTFSLEVVLGHFEFYDKQWLHLGLNKVFCFELLHDLTSYVCRKDGAFRNKPAGQWAGTTLCRSKGDAECLDDSEEAADVSKVGSSWKPLTICEITIST